MIQISGTVVGFSSTTYFGTETSGSVTVCVEVLNPPSGGATQPFSASLHSGGYNYYLISITIIL